jgi:hypothetical protein
MSPKTSFLTTGLTALGLFGFAALHAAAADGLPGPSEPTSTPAPAATAAPASPEAPSPSPTVLLLSNGRLLNGAVVEVGSDYVLHQKGGTIRFRKTDVIRAFGSISEVYHYKREQFPDDDPDEHLKLARWCLSQNLREEAKAELQAVVALSPKSGEAKAMLASIEAYEARAAAQPRVDSDVMRSGGEVATPGAQVQRPEELDPALLKGAARALGIGGLVIFDLPPAVAVKRAEHFARYVHPVLQASCVKCHGERYDGRFQLVEAKPGRRVSPDALRANLDATLALVKPDDPTKSELLTSVLMPHGNGPKKKPIFRGSNDPNFQILLAWVTSLRNKPASASNMSTDGVTPARFGTAPAPRESQGGGGFATDRGNAGPAAGGVDPSAVMMPSNVRREVIAPPPARYVPGQGMVAETQPPAPGEFPVSPLVGGPKPTPVGPKTATAGTAPAIPGSLPELPGAANAPDGASPDDATKTDKSDKPKKTFKLDPNLLQRALMNRNGNR